MDVFWVIFCQFKWISLAFLSKKLKVVTFSPTTSVSIVLSSMKAISILFNWLFFCCFYHQQNNCSISFPLSLQFSLVSQRVKFFSLSSHHWDQFPSFSTDKFVRLCFTHSWVWFPWVSYDWNRFKWVFY